MTFPEFVGQVPRLRVQDPLTRMLGCAEDGILEYGFGDAVRLTGHFCPTVAAAYWLTFLALEHLYPDSLPQRGDIRVEFRDDARTGSTGIVAAVVQLLTGAGRASAFKGIHGRFGRVGLMRYKPDLPQTLRFTRLATGTAVDACAELSLVPAHDDTEALLRSCSMGKASVDDQLRLRQLWQDRVRRLLTDFARDASVFTLEPVRWRGAAVQEREAVLDRRAQAAWSSTSAA